MTYEEARGLPELLHCFLKDRLPSLGSSALARSVPQLCHVSLRRNPKPT